MNLIFFIGSYTEMITPTFGGSGKGIYTMQIDLLTDKTTLLHTYFTKNPSYLALSDNGEYLYCVNEVTSDKNPKVEAYKIQDDYSLKLINEQKIKGSLPCHIEFANDLLFIACYGSGNLQLFTTTNNGSIIDSAQNFNHFGKSVNPERQESPHAHQTVIHPNGIDVFVPDLGLDTLKAYTLQESTLTPTKNHDVQVKEGGGPRHMVFNNNGDLGYVLNELSGDISIIKQKGEHFSLIKTLTSLPNSFSGTPSSSAIRIHPNGKYLFAGNRNLDAISIFEINGDDLQLIDCQYTNGKTLREFNITPDGNWLIACLQDSNEIIVYKVSTKGILNVEHRITNINAPVCVSFLETTNP